MSIEVTITQKGIFKKTLPLETIIGNELKYGEFDGLRLDEGKLGESEFIAYHPKHIGRGFSVVWNQNEKNKVELRLLTPATRDELQDFYDAVLRITDEWKCKLELDGVEMTPSEFKESFEGMSEFQQSTLKEMAKRVMSGADENLTLFSAMWPLVMGKEEAEQILDNPNFFAQWMHEKQAMDVYYAKPRFYRMEKGIEGRFAITEETRSVFPLKPYVPFGMTDPETNQALECKKYSIALYSMTLQDVIGEMEYDTFLEKLDKNKYSRYDANHLLIEDLTLEEMKEMLEVS